MIVLKGEKPPADSLQGNDRPPFCVTRFLLWAFTVNPDKLRRRVWGARRSQQCPLFSCLVKNTHKTLEDGQLWFLCTSVNQCEGAVKLQIMLLGADDPATNSTSLVPHSITHPSVLKQQLWPVCFHSERRSSWSGSSQACLTKLVYWETQVFKRQHETLDIILMAGHRGRAARLTKQNKTQAVACKTGLIRKSS